MTKKLKTQLKTFQKNSLYNTCTTPILHQYYNPVQTVVPVQNKNNESKKKIYRHPSSYRKHINAEHYALRNEIGLDADGVFIPDQKPNQMSPNKQYTKIFGQDGYMEIGEFHNFQAGTVISN